MGQFFFQKGHVKRDGGSISKTNYRKSNYKLKQLDMHHDAFDIIDSLTNLKSPPKANKNENRKLDDIDLRKLSPKKEIY